MEIKLMMDGKFKTFKTKFINGRAFREAIVLQKEIQEGGVTIDIIDKLVEFVVMVFGNQFTIDDFYDGIENTEMFTKMLAVVTYAINGKN